MSRLNTLEQDSIPKSLEFTAQSVSECLIRRTRELRPGSPLPTLVQDARQVATDLMSLYSSIAMSNAKQEDIAVSVCACFMAKYNAETPSYNTKLKNRIRLKIQDIELDVKESLGSQLESENGGTSLSDPISPAQFFYPPSSSNLPVYERLVYDEPSVQLCWMSDLVDGRKTWCGERPPVRYYTRTRDKNLRHERAVAVGMSVVGLENWT